MVIRANGQKDTVGTVLMSAVHFGYSIDLI